MAYVKNNYKQILVVFEALWMAGAVLIMMGPGSNAWAVDGSPHYEGGELILESGIAGIGNSMTWTVGVEDFLAAKDYRMLYTEEPFRYPTVYIGGCSKDTVKEVLREI